MRLPRRSEVDDASELMLARRPSSRVPVASPALRRARQCEVTVHTWLEGELPDEAATGRRGRRARHGVAADRRGGCAGACVRARPSTCGPRRCVRSALERVDAPGALELWEESLQAPGWDGRAGLDPRATSMRGTCSSATAGSRGVLDWGGAGVGDPARRRDGRVEARGARGARPVPRRCSTSTTQRGSAPRAGRVSQALSALGYYTLENYPPLVHEATRIGWPKLRSG